MNLDELKTFINKNIEEKTSDLKQFNKEARDKISEKAEELKDKTEKSLEKIKLENLIPEIKQIIFEKVASKLKEFNFLGYSTDKIFTIVFQSAYSFLPAPIRFLVKEDSFVEFCIKNKEHILTHKSTSKENQSIEAETISNLHKAGVLTEAEYREQISKIAK